MNLSKIFIKRPVMTILVMIFIVAFGTMGYKALPINDLPSVDFPVITVTTVNPGSSPETMANTVATPLEREFMSIDGLQAMTSNSVTGTTTIVLQFNLNKSLDSASLDVESAINRALPNLPADLPYNPTYQKVNPADTPILFYAITSPSIPVSRLYDYGNTIIGQRMSMVEGVSEILTFGSPYAARIQIDPPQIAAMGLGIDEVAQAIQYGNVELPLGTLYNAKNEYTIDMDGQLMDAAGYNNLVVRTQDGALVKIDQIGRALDSLQDDKYYLRYLEKGQPASHTVIIAVQKQVGSNAIEIIEGIDKLLPDLHKELPSSLTIHKIYDKAENIKEALFDVELTLVIAFILIVMIIFFMLGKALDTLIPTLALPMSIFGTFGMMFLLGYSLDVFSMLAITLSIGFLVDDAIVVLENNVRHVEMGKTPLEASLEGSKEISITILSMTLCLAAVFIPMLFMGGIIGRLFREFSVTIIVAITISGFISLTFTPLLCSRFIPPAGHKKHKKFFAKLAEKINSVMLKAYKPMLHKVMDHKWVMLIVGATCIALSLHLAIILPKDFLPATDMGFINGYSESQDGTSPYQMANYQQALSDVIQKNPYVEKAVSVASTTTDNEGLMFVKLIPYDQRPSIDEVTKQLMDDMSPIPGVNSFLSPIPLINLQLGTQSKALYQYALTSIDQDQVEKGLTSLLDRVKGNEIFTQVSTDLQISQPQLEMHILRDRASDLNLTANQIEQSLKFAFSGGKLSLINSPINQYYVIIETLPKYYKDPSVIQDLYVRSQTDNLVPLSEVVEIKETVGPLSVNHFNGIPSATISFNLAPGASLGDAANVLDNMAKEVLPAQVSGNLQGTLDIFKNSFASLPFLFIVMLFVVYVILGILYENFMHPITVMSALPPATFGGLLTLYLFDQTLSLMSFLGLIMLMGIVMKNGVILIDFANERIEKDKLKPVDAIIKACEIRFRPIMMTTIAAFMGALPIALALGGPSSQGNKSLGLVVAGGLLVSQLLTLLLTPVIFYYLESLREKVNNYRKKIIS